MVTLIYSYCITDGGDVSFTLYSLPKQHFQSQFSRCHSHAVLFAYLITTRCYA